MTPRAVFVIGAISSFGASAAAARTELRRAYRSADTRVAWAAFDALATQGDDEPLPGLISILDSPEPAWRRERAVRLLLGYGPRAKVGIPDFLRLLEKGDPDAAGLLGALGDPVAVDPLARSLRIEDYRLRAIALEALAGFGPAAASAVPAIEAMTGNWAPIVRARAWEALHAIAGREVSEPTPRPTPTCLATATDCPLVTESGTIPLKVAHPSVPNECAQLAKAVKSDLGVLFGRSCIFRVNHGEWGTWFIEADRVSGKTRQFCCGTGQFVMVHGRLLAIGHHVEAFDRAPDGSAKLERLGLGPGPPSAYGLDANGDLVFMAHGIGDLEPSAPKWPERWSPYRGGTGERDDSPKSTFVLRLDPAGQLIEVH